MKPFLVMSCPCATRSGYGSHSRDLFKALDQMDQYDIKIISQRWGNCPLNVLTESNPDHKRILDNIISDKLERQPDIWIQITVPNEYQPVGKFNIGITAGIESTAIPKDWIDGCNKMDLIIVPSKHSKDVIVATGYTEADQQGNKVRDFRVEKPIEVLFEGVDTEIYG